MPHLIDVEPERNKFQFCSNPGEERWKAAKRILRYVKGTIDYGITFDGNKETDVQLQGYVDADWGSNPNGRKSQSGYLFTLRGGVISWASKKQSVVALSSTEAEYVAASLVNQEAVWLRALLGDISFVQEEPTMIKEDNQGAIALSKNPKYHPRTKHIDINNIIFNKHHNTLIMFIRCSHLFQANIVFAAKTANDTSQLS